MALFIEYSPAVQEVPGLNNMSNILRYFMQRMSSLYTRSKLKNQKHIAVDVLFKAYPMIPLSG
jgi:hypothetical protein